MTPAKLPTKFKPCTTSKSETSLKKKIRKEGKKKKKKNFSREWGFRFVCFGFSFLLLWEGGMRQESWFWIHNSKLPTWRDCLGETLVCYIAPLSLFPPPSPLPWTPCSENTMKLVCIYRYFTRLNKNNNNNNKKLNTKMNRLVGLLFSWIFFFLFLIFFPNVTSVAEQDSNYWWFFLCSWLLGTGSGGVGGWCCSYTIGLNSFSCVNICKQETRRGERKKTSSITSKTGTHWKQQLWHSPQGENHNSYQDAVYLGCSPDFRACRWNNPIWEKMEDSL